MSFNMAMIPDSWEDPELTTDFKEVVEKLG